MKPLLGLAFVTLILTGCGNENKQEVQDLRLQLENSRAQLTTAQSRIEGAESELTESKSAASTLKERVGELETQLRHQSAAMDEQEKAKKAANAKIEELTDKLRKLYAPTSSAIEILEDLTLRATAAETGDAAKRMCDPVCTQLTEIAKQMAPQCRAALLVNSAFKDLHSYSTMIGAYAFNIASEASVLADHEASMGNDPGDPLEVLTKKNTDEATSKIRSDFTDLKENLRDCVALLKEQRQLME